jgi:hypothetical protein
MPKVFFGQKLAVPSVANEEENKECDINTQYFLIGVTNRVDRTGRVIVELIMTVFSSVGHS